MQSRVPLGPGKFHVVVLVQLQSDSVISWCDLIPNLIGLWVDHNRGLMWARLQWVFLVTVILENLFWLQCMKKCIFHVLFCFVFLLFLFVLFFACFVSALLFSRLLYKSIWSKVTKSFRTPIHDYGYVMTRSFQFAVRQTSVLKRRCHAVWMELQ